MTLSLCMIVKNEEDTLGRCLDSVKDAVDEIIVADTGSVDNTVAVAEARGAKIVRFAWRDDFAAARNFAFSHASCDYIMWLDADDVIEPDDLARLIALKKTLTPAVREVAARYDVAFDEEDRPTLSYFRERIFLRSAGFLWQGEVHETIPLAADTFYADFAVKHRKIHPTEAGRNLKIYRKIAAAGKPMSPRQQYYYARELYYNGYYAEAAALFAQFLEETAVWPPDRIEACLLLSRCKAELGETGETLDALFRSFRYGAPTGEICCEIGHRFLERNDVSTAAYWYLRATEAKDAAVPGAFVYSDCTDYIPKLQLCVCYDRLGDVEKAAYYNELAALVKPNSEAVRQNRIYFAAKRTGTQKGS